MMGVSSLLILLSWFLHAAVAANTIIVNVPRECLQLTRRPNHPDAESPSDRVNFYLNTRGQEEFSSRHHIIPYSVLRDFYNNALDEAIYSTVLGTHISSRLVRIATYFLQDPELGHSRQNNMFRVLEYQDEGTTLDLDFHDRMMSAFVWMPGNLFYGPSPNLRGPDDPGDNFEINAGAIVGDIAIARLRTLYNNIIRFNDNTDRTRTNFENIMQDMNEVWNCRELPYAFRREQWDNRNGVWYIRPRTNPRKKRQSLKNGEIFPYNSDAGDSPYYAAFDFCTLAASAAAVKKTETISDQQALCVSNAVLVVAAFAELCFTSKIKRNKRYTSDGRGEWWNCQVDYNQPPSLDNVIFDPKKEVFWTERYSMGPKVGMVVSLNTGLAITQVFLNKDNAFFVDYMKSLLWCMRYSHINAEIVDITLARNDLGDIIYKQFYKFKETLNAVIKAQDDNTLIECVHNSNEFYCITHKYKST